MLVVRMCRIHTVSGAGVDGDEQAPESARGAWHHRFVLREDRRASRIRYGLARSREVPPQCCVIQRLSISAG